jgi:hypothetical protein
MKRKIYSNLFLCVLLFMLCATPAFAVDLTGSNFIIRDPVIGSGGGYASSGSFKLFQSIDPTLIGVGSSALYVGHYGFLYFPEPDDDVVVPPGPGGGGGGADEGIKYDLRCNGLIADLNCDGKVNLFDLSILLYYMKHPGSFDAFHDLNKDGKIDLADISVLFYYWDED